MGRSTGCPLISGLATNAEDEFRTVKGRLNVLDRHLQAVGHVCARGQIHPCSGLDVNRSDLTPLAVAVQRRVFELDRRHSGTVWDKGHTVVVHRANLPAHSSANRCWSGSNANTARNANLGRARLEVDAGFQGKAAEAGAGLNEAIGPADAKLNIVDSSDGGGALEPNAQDARDRLPGDVLVIQTPFAPLGRNFE